MHKIDYRSLSTRLRGGLINAQLSTWEEVAAKSEAELLRLPNIGRKSVNEVRDALRGCGLKLRPTPIPGPTSDEIRGEIDGLEWLIRVAKGELQRMQQRLAIKQRRLIVRRTIEGKQADV